MTWLVFGDSHIGTIRHAADSGWLERECEFTGVAGATAVGLRNPNSATNALDIFREHLLPPRRSAVPVMHLGEVDCCFVIWWRAAHLAEGVEVQLEASLAAYAEFVDALLAAGYPTVVITGATVPTIRDGQEWGDVANKRREVAVPLRERTQLTLRYNARLASLAAERGCPFIDISPQVLNPETGVVDDRFRSDDPLDHHLHAERAGRLWAGALSAVLP